MAKTKEELNNLKNECNSLGTKLKELTDEELTEVAGGSFSDLWDKIKNLSERAKKVASTNTLIPPYPIKPDDWRSSNPVPENTGEYKL